MSGLGGPISSGSLKTMFFICNVAAILMLLSSVVYSYKETEAEKRQRLFNEDQARQYSETIIPKAEEALANNNYTAAIKICNDALDKIKNNEYKKI